MRFSTMLMDLILYNSTAASLRSQGASRGGRGLARCKRCGNRCSCRTRAGQMFELVDDVERYPKFLPWCGGAKVLDRSDDGKTARIDIDYHGVKAHFTTDNVERRRREDRHHAEGRAVQAPARRVALPRARRGRVARSSSSSRTSSRPPCSRRSSDRCSTISRTRSSMRSCAAPRSCTPGERARSPTSGPKVRLWSMSSLARAPASPMPSPRPGIVTRLRLFEAALSYAIHGQPARRNTPVRAGDRVELLRPLIADPKEARRKRAAANPIPRAPRRPRARG